MDLLGQLSDLHVRVGSEDAEGARRVAATVRAAAAFAPMLTAVVITGDIAENGTEREYDRAKELLAPLTMPIHVIAGNHDDPDALAAAFGSTPRWAARVGGLRLVGLDTTVPDSDGGALGEERLAWIGDTLAQDTAPTLLAMHHPPIETGVAAMDEMGLPAADRAALGDVLAGAPQVRRVISGHVHRAVTGRIAGCPVTLSPSAERQLSLDLAGGHDLRFTNEPPAFMVHVAVDGDVASHVQEIT
jgi:3',5'-cyclic AMP phosphodiesterase CpdA